MNHKEYLLAELRAASARVKFYGLDIDAIGLSLTYGIINEEQAVRLIRDRGLDCFIGEGARLVSEVGALGNGGNKTPVRTGSGWVRKRRDSSPAGPNTGSDRGPAAVVAAKRNGAAPVERGQGGSGSQDQSGGT
jgi:hypothetical protein